MSAALAMLGSDDVWRHMSYALMQRADELGVAFPIADDARELMAGMTGR